MSDYSNHKVGRDTLSRQDLLTLLNVMKEKERSRQSEELVIPSMDIREIISRLMLDKTESIRFNYSTYFVALRYYDRIASRFLNDISVQGKIGLMCLLVAAKYEEVEENLPPYSIFYGNPSGMYSNLDQMLRYEKYVIEELHWDLGYSSVVHYLDILMSLGLILDGDTHSQCPCSADTSKYLNDYISFFIKLSFHEPTFSLYKPLQQTGAVIMAARRAVNISPVWRDDLADLVGVQFNEFRECYERLWNIFCSKYAKKTKEEIKPSPTNIFFS